LAGLTEAKENEIIRQCEKDFPQFTSSIHFIEYNGEKFIVVEPLIA
jgi:hypothetical protein